MLALTLLLTAATSTVDMLVLIPDAAAIAADERTALTQALTRALDGRDGLRVSSVVDVQQLATIEAARQAVDCGDDGACLAEIGAAFGTRLMVSGRISRVDDRFVWQAALVDVQTGVTVRRAEVDAVDVGALLGRVPDVARGLVPIEATMTRRTLLGTGWSLVAVGMLAAGVFGGWTLLVDDALQRPTSPEAQARAYAEAAWVPWVFVGGLGVAAVGGSALVAGSVIE